MLNFRKIALAAIALILAVIFAVLAFAESDEYTGTVEEASEKLTAVQSAATLGDKLSAMAELNEYLTAAPVDPETSGYSDFIDKVYSERLGIAKWLLSLLATEDINTAHNAILIRRLSAFLRENQIPESTVGYSDFENELQEKLEAHNCEVAKNRKEIYESAVRSDYLEEIYFRDDFDSSAEKSIFEVRSDIDKADGSKNFAGKEDADGNRYFTIRHNTKINAKDTHVAVGNTRYDFSAGFVMEFDFTTFGELPADEIRADHDQYEYPDGEKKFMCFFAIQPNGDITADGEGKQVLLENAVVRGEWMHISMVFTPDFYVNLYVDYELVGTYYVGHNDYISPVYTVRIGTAMGSYTGEFSIDNFALYRGTLPRELDYVTEESSKEEWFLLYTSILPDTASRPMLVKQAYDEASKMLSEFYDVNSREYLTEDEELKSAVDVYLAFNYSEFLLKVKEENSKTFAEMVEELSEIARLPGTNKERNSKLTKIDKFITDNTGFMAYDDNYTWASELLWGLREELKSEELMSNLCEKINRYFASSGRAALENLYYDITKDLTEAQKSSDVVNCMKSVAFAEVKALCDKFREGAVKRLYEAVCMDNSKQFISIGTIFSDYGSDEWDENFDMLNYFLGIAEGYISEDFYPEDPGFTGDFAYFMYEPVNKAPHSYDPYYPCFAEAMSLYLELREHFYEENQQRYAKKIADELLNFDNADTYAEKFGIYSVLEAYIKESGADLSHPAVKEQYSKFLSYRAELFYEEEKYLETLAENADKFLAVIAELKAATNYREKRALADEAVKYVFAMDVDSEAVEAAKAYYLAVRLELEATELSSMLLVAEYATYNSAASEAKRFASLVRASKLLPEADASVDGVAPAYNGFLSAIESYDENSVLKNGEIHTMISAVAALECDSVKTAAIMVKNTAK